MQRVFAGSRLALLVLAAVMLLFGSGCGAAKAAINPKVAWALKDPAPMSVVVRRADAAEKTSHEVDRLLASTPTNVDSEWLQAVGPSPDTATAEKKTVAELPFYAESHARVVPSEVWARTLSALKSGKGHYKSLMAAIDDDLADKYGKIEAKEQELVGLKSLVAAEQAAIDDKDASAEDKAEHQKKKDELQKMADAAAQEIAPLQAAVLAAAKDSGGKAKPEVREKVGVALVNFRQALDDAQVANGAAALRYPLATPTVLSSLKAVVPVIVADIVEEQTGKRPTLKKLSPDVGLDGGKVTLTLNGLEPGDIGKIKMGDLVTESLKRSTKWVTHTTTLLVSIGSTNDALKFQSELVGALIDGFAAGGWTATLAAKIPGDDDGSSGTGVASAANAAGTKVTDATKTATKSATKDVKAATGDADKVAKGAGKDVTKAADKVTRDVSTQGIDKSANKVGKDVTKAGNNVAANPTVKKADKDVTKAGNSATASVGKSLHFKP
jgi:hypothetical protein